MNLSSKALNLIFEKPKNYEMRFFLQTMIDEISKKVSLKNDYEYAIILYSKYATYSNMDILNWGQERISMLGNLMISLEKLIKEAFPFFYAEPGKHSDLKGLYYTSETYARIYESIINWTIQTSST